MNRQIVPAPRDGLSTRDRRYRPILAVHTGDGKGKSTAAFGMALRGWHQGWSIGVFQFVKSGKWRSGEQAAFEALSRLGTASGAGGTPGAEDEIDRPGLTLEPNDGLFIFFTYIGNRTPILTNHYIINSLFINTVHF